KNTEGTRNTFEGSKAGAGNLDGDDNTCIGYEAGDVSYSGNGNTFLGSGAGGNTQFGDDNVFVGRLAGQGNTNADNGTFVGAYAGTQARFGPSNVGLGYFAGANVTTGNTNTLLGAKADVDDGALVGATAVGYGARVNRQNAMAFGSTDVNYWSFGRSSTDALGICLQVGVSGTFNGNGAYLTNGGTWTNASDVNLKENIRPANGAEVLGLIRQLPISRWSYKGTKGETHLGPMAQDFYRLFHLGLNDTSISTIDPAGVALAGVQELARQNDQLRTENARLHQQLEALRTGQTTLESRLATLERVVAPATAQR
ncbi:MAG TPA: tail fiber domain-containing protein, partial [Hymenobacter sp.]